MTVFGFIYLCNRIYQFAPVKKTDLTRYKRNMRIVEIVTDLLAFVLLLCLLIGYINAAVTIIHLLIFWLLSDLLFYIIRKARKNKRFSYNFAGMLAIVTTVIYLSVGWVLAHNVVATQYTVYTDKEVGNLRIVMFADSHVGSTFDGDGFKKHVQSMQSYDPDIVIIAGDYVDDDTSREDMIDSCRALGTLKTTYGVYYACGNHDKGYYSDSHRNYSAKDLFVELEKNGVTVLQDEVTLVDDRFYIVGRQEAEEHRRGKARAEIGELTAGLDSSKYSIVINHQPTDYANEAKAGVDLVLSGHTHGGQMFPIGLISDVFGLNDRVYGREHRGNTDFIVTSGISDWAFKFKTGCYSEFVVIDIKGK